MSRISPGTLTLGILAILVGLGGAYAVRLYLKPEPVVERPVATPDRQPIPVASLELPAGRTIRYGDIGLMSRSAVQGGVPANTMVNPDDIIGRVLRQPVKLGEPFTTVKLYPEGTGPRVTEELSPGLRAAAVMIDAHGTLGGQLQPGMKVDVLFRAERRDGRDGFEQIPEVTVKLFEGLEVLTVKQAPNDSLDRDTPQEIVTLACRPDEASKLQAIQGRGDISLTLWSDADEDADLLTNRQGMTLEEILGIDPVREFQTEVYRGTSRSVSTFPPKKNIEQRPSDVVKTTVPQVTGAGMEQPVKEEAPSNNSSPSLQ